MNIHASKLNIEIITQNNLVSLEFDIKSWLKRNKDKIILDIKHSINSEYYSAMILYKDEEKLLS